MRTAEIEHLMLHIARIGVANATRVLEEAMQADFWPDPAAMAGADSAHPGKF